MFVDPIATVLEGVEWSFARNRYKDIPSFVKGVGLFHQQAHGAAPAWQPDRVVIPGDTIRVRLAPQLVPTSYGGLESQERAGEGSRIVTLRSAKGFTAAGLLFEAHNALRDGLKDAPDQLLHTIVQTKHSELFEPALYEVRTKYWLGTPAEQPRGELAADVLRGVYWNFRNCGQVKDRDAFVERVHAYERDLHAIAKQPEPPPPPFDPSSIVIPAPVIWVNYMVNHRDRMVILRSPDGFTAGELLHALHNDAAPRMGRTDHVFFEGLVGPLRYPTMPPGYAMSLGS